MRFSRAYDIVNSELWANLREENGIDGWIKGMARPPGSEETRKKIGKGQIGKKHSLEHCKHISKSHKGICFSKEHCENIAKAQIRKQKWLVTAPNGNEQIINGLYKFCMENNLNTGNMIHVSRGKYKHHKGWKCQKMEATI